MGKIREGKLLYHLTKLSNLDTIIEHGLLSRKDIIEKNLGFDDVADSEIIKFRKEHNLEEYIPFHFFGNTPFDGVVRKKHEKNDFIYLCIHRNYAECNDFSIIPKHPLSMTPFKIYNYKEGLNAINWDTMEKRDYHNEECKQICMAECLCAKYIPIHDFQSIKVKDERVHKIVEEKLMRISGIHIDIVEGLFS